MSGSVIEYFVLIDYLRRLSLYSWRSCGRNCPTMPLEPIRCVLGSLANRRDTKKSKAPALIRRGSCVSVGQKGSDHSTSLRALMISSRVIWELPTSSFDLPVFAFRTTMDGVEFTLNCSAIFWKAVICWVTSMKLSCR